MKRKILAVVLIVLVLVNGFTITSLAHTEECLFGGHGVETQVNPSSPVGGTVDLDITHTVEINGQTVSVEDEDLYTNTIEDEEYTFAYTKYIVSNPTPSPMYNFIGYTIELDGSPFNEAIASTTQPSNGYTPDYYLIKSDTDSDSIVDRIELWTKCFVFPKSGEEYLAPESDFLVTANFEKEEPEFSASKTASPSTIPASSSSRTTEYTVTYSATIGNYDVLIVDMGSSTLNSPFARAIYNVNNGSVNFTSKSFSIPSSDTTYPNTATIYFFESGSLEGYYEADSATILENLFTDGDITEGAIATRTASASVTVLSEDDPPPPPTYYTVNAQAINRNDATGSLSNNSITTTGTSSRLDLAFGASPEGQFLGYYNDADGNTLISTDIAATISTIAYNGKTVYAIFDATAPAQYDVNVVVVNLNIADGSVAPTAKSFSEGTNVTIADEFTPAGDGFVGFFSDADPTSTVVSEITNISQDETVYAIFDLEDEIIVPEEDTAEATPELPQTAGFPVEVIYTLGAVLTTTGILMRRKKEDEE